MIEHLRGRERKLEPLGWTGQEAEWIALVCLHSGVFTRAQFCHYFGVWRSGAQRFVQTLLDRRAAVASTWPRLNGGAKTYRISNKAIYRALGVEDIRHRRKASKPVVMRRLLSLDFVLEHPGMNWLPAEPEKVEFFEKLSLPRRLIPRRIYYGVAGNQKRYFALKLPLAADPKTVTFAYVDPGHSTTTELHSWGAAHGPLWDALRMKGRQVRVIGIAVENTTVDRTARVLEAWAAAEPGKPDEGLTVKQEIKAIHDAISRRDGEDTDQILATGLLAGKPFSELHQMLWKVVAQQSRSSPPTTRSLRVAWFTTRVKWITRFVGFLGTGGRMVLGTRSEGGVYKNFCLRCTTPTFLYLTHSAVVIPCESPPPCRTGKKEGDESDPPPKRGGM